MSPAEIQQLWKEVATQSGIDSSVDMKNHLNGVALATSVAQAAAVAAASVTSGSMNPLLQSSSYLTNGIPDGYLLSGKYLYIFLLVCIGHFVLVVNLTRKKKRKCVIKKKTLFNPLSVYICYGGLNSYTFRSWFRWSVI